VPCKSLKFKQTTQLACLSKSICLYDEYSGISARIEPDKQCAILQYCSPLY